MNNNFKEYVESHSKSLSLDGSISFPEAERRAGQFLQVLATITNFRHMFNEDKIKLQSIQTAVYATELAKGTAKTMTENKVTAEASGEYTHARESLESIDNDLSYLKAYYDIFMAGHIFYRQMARGESS